MLKVYKIAWTLKLKNFNTFFYIYTITVLTYLQIYVFFIVELSHQIYWNTIFVHTINHKIIQNEDRCHKTKYEYTRNWKTSNL